MFTESRTFIIAELSQTHEGFLTIAKMLIKAAAEAKADAVKVQVFTADELAVPSYKHYRLFKQLEWPEASWKELIDFSHDCGLKIFADVFGSDSVNMLMRNGIDGLKIHGTDMRNFRLLRRLADVELPLLLSIGGGTIEETKSALSIIKKKKSPIVLMHGFQSYPTLVEHTNLEKMRYFKDQFKLPVGFADHIGGDHRLNFGLCATAIGMGAVVIEKHITTSRTLKMEDYESALSPDEFVKFVAKIRELDSAMGNYSEEMFSVEKDYRKATRKHVVADIPIKAEQMIREKDITLRRVDSDKMPS
ncbi:MAG: N-acetylneuraminate synthase family protein, partial [Candidatus Aenigmarchaeota archaeon]|nr:N-acetylneuraminate synthase family protein [Candidatus Aenigmarchaeota archaeon]